MYLDILNKIKEYKTIAIYRHENPDGDAVGSQLGLKYWIIDNFNNKNVYALGKGVYDVYPEVDLVDDEALKDSLAIILDCGNLPRVDDQRYSLSKEIIKIDHHPDNDVFGAPRIVDPSASATCQIITNFIFSFKEYKVSYKVAEYLYSGLLTDTLSFTTSNTTKDTFDAASKLLSLDIKPNAISDKVFSITYNQFKSANYVRNNHVFEDGLAYTLVDLTTQKEFNLQGSDFRNRVAELGSVKDIKIWCIFTEEEDGKWRGSLRSRNITINHIAEKFNGGGHSNACGVKFSCKQEIYELINVLKSLII